MPKTKTSAATPAAKARATTTKAKKPRKPAATKRIVPLHKRTLIGTFKLHHIGGMALLVIGALWGGAVLVSQPPLGSSAQGCSVSSTLVNSCRPWLGAAVNNYPQAADDTKAQLLYHEQRIGRQLDIVHTYHPIGDNDLSSTDTYFANRANTYVFANWKPTDKWGKAGGNDTGVNAGIDKMARSVKALGSKKIFMTLNHEPENDVSGGANGCSVSYVGDAGTPTEYRAMWRNVQNRFKAVGATNVVWVMDYMNYPKWDCMVDDLYPGNDLVDWIMFNGYGVKDENFSSEVGHFYNLLTKSSSNTHNYLSKPWGIVEWGIKDPTATQAIAYYKSASDSLNANSYPRLKAYMVFDARHKGASDGENYRVGYDSTGKFNQNVQNAYNGFAKHTRLVSGGTGTPSPTTPTTPKPTPPTSDGKDRTPPTIRLAQPVKGTTESGGMNIAGVARDNVKIKAVTLRVDDAYVETDDKDPYTFRLDTSKYSNGKHTIALRAWDTSDNVAQSETITVIFKNDGAPAAAPTTPKPSTRVVTASTGATSPQTAKPSAAPRTIIVSPSTAGSAVRVWVNGKLWDTNSIDTINLTNGTHTIKVEENGVIRYQKVSVSNPTAIAALNTVRANAITYGAVAGFVLAVAAFYIFRPYLWGLTSARERAVVRSQRTNYKR